jgi:hypothetical protein
MTKIGRITPTIPRSTVIGRRVGVQPADEAEHLVSSASDLSGILGCFDRDRQSRRLFNMSGVSVRLVLGLRQLWLRFLKPFFDCRLPRHYDFSVTLHGSNTDAAN